MNSSTFLFSIAALTIALALSGCGRKPEVKAEASKPENPFAMKEVPSPTVTPTTADSATLAQAPQAEGNSDVAAPATAGIKGNAGGATTAQNVQLLPGATAEQNAAVKQTAQAAQAASANVSKQTPSKIRLKNGHEAANDAQ